MISKLYEQKIKRDLLRLAVLTVVVVVIWIGLEVYRSTKQSQLGPEIKKQLSPLTPSIDLDTMENIKQRQQVLPENWSSIKRVLEIPTASEATASGE
jgi:hypothetical protein